MTASRPTEIGDRPVHGRATCRTCTPPPAGHLRADQLWTWSLRHPGQRPFRVTKPLKVSPGMSQSGLAVIEWMLGIVFVILPVTAIAVCAINWPPRVDAAHGAAYEATKAVLTTGDLGAGEARAQEVWANHGFTDALTVSFTGDLSSRGGALTATVTVTLPILHLPGIGVQGGQSYSTSHTERQPDYRSQS